MRRGRISGVFKISGKGEEYCRGAFKASWKRGGAFMTSWGIGAEQRGVCDKLGGVCDWWSVGGV